MTSLSFLVTELQSLATETRRKHPEIREAAEKSLAILRASPEQANVNLASDGPQAEILLKPVFMGCATKSSKVVSISLGSLQRLINLRAVPQSAVPRILATMNDVLPFGVDIQLRVLQTLVSLVPNFPGVRGELLGDALLLCFKLQESRIAVVSSTAAATLRQLVMFVVDKMVADDQGEEIQRSAANPNETTSEDRISVPLPGGDSALLSPSARDVYVVFEDLCLLANGETPNFLKLDFLHKTFALELIESILTNYYSAFRHHSELILLLRHHLCPLLLKTLSERPMFSLMLRSTRVVFLIFKQFMDELETEAEVFFMLLLRIILGDPSESSNIPGAEGHAQRPLWMRVLSMEIMRGLCSDSDLLRNIFSRYDAKRKESNVFGSLVAALNRLITEKPALLGISTQMSGVGVREEIGGNALEVVGGMAGRVATGVAEMISTSPGLSQQGSSMKLQCIDQLDKADAPPIPESYIYLLAVQCLVTLSAGFLSFTAPLYTSIVIQQRASTTTPQLAPPALDFATLPEKDSSTIQLYALRSMIESGWPPLLAALSSVIVTNLSNELFVDVLASYQSLVNVSGMLGLTTPRDAFITSLSKFAVPTLVVSSLDTYTDAPAPRSATSALSEGFGLGGFSGPPGLSERNLACLKVLISSAIFLAGSLGDSWFNVLEVLQNADYVLTAKGQSISVQGSPMKKSIFSGGGSGGMPTSRSVSLPVSSSQSGQLNSLGTGGKHPLLMDLDVETLQSGIQRLFDSSKTMEDLAFTDFVSSLCRLSSAMVGMQSMRENVTNNKESPVNGRDSLDEVAGTNSSLAPKMDPAHRRRLSGIHIPKTLRSGDFGITKLGEVAMLNIHRLIYRSPDVAWNIITHHLISIIRLYSVPQAIRIQAARVLDEILLVVPRTLSSPEVLQSQVQNRVLDVLAQQVVPDSSQLNSSTSTSVELRRMGLETLRQILQTSGHTLLVGWETIFLMLGSVCKPPNLPLVAVSIDSELSPILPSAVSQTSWSKPLGLGTPSERSFFALVKIAFQSLTLVCDSISTLSPDHLRQCITTLGLFGRQADTNIALTAAASLLWSVSDAIQAKRKNIDDEPEYSELWMFLLVEVLGLCTDPRPEVRDGAIQTLFRNIKIFGLSLSPESWDRCLWKITFPLLDALMERPQEEAISVQEVPAAQAWNDSKILALNSIGSIFHDFLATKLISLTSFTKAWNALVDYIQTTVLLDSRPISAPALLCLDKAIKAIADVEAEYQFMVPDIVERVWEMIDTIGTSILKEVQPPNIAGEDCWEPYTQESLVTFVDVIQSTRRTSRKCEGKEWNLLRLTRLMLIMKGVLTYSTSPDYRPDIDSLPPVQAIVMDTIVNIDLAEPGAPSLVMRDLSEYATLPFMAAFDVQLPTGQGQAPQKRITYIALAKKTMPMLVDIFLQFKERSEIYRDGTLESLLSSYSIPIKLKYDCPAPSKFGNDLPLWKTAVSCFLRLVKECTVQMKLLEQDIPDSRVEGIWRQLLVVFKGGILADCSGAETFPLEVQTLEENFDYALLASLQADVVPLLGDPRVPDDVVSLLGKILHPGSCLYGSEEAVIEPLSSSRRSSLEYAHFDQTNSLGTTDFGATAPRERFSYWCLDLLFLISSASSNNGNESACRRLAALSLPSLLHRCRTTLASFVADESLRGNLPFPRAREEELIYVLRKLKELKLWPGSLWAALSDDPTKYSISQPALDIAELSTSMHMADIVKRSTLGHLFHFYSLFCDIASIPRRTPTFCVAAGTDRMNDILGTISNGTQKSGSVGAHFEEIDARSLAKACLKEAGKEMGVCR